MKFIVLSLALVSFAAQAAHVHVKPEAISLTPEMVSAQNINAIIASHADEKLPLTILLPEGSFKLEYPVLIARDNVRLIGKGSKRTFISVAEDNPLPAIIIGSLKTKIMHVKYDLPYPDRVVRNITVQGVDLDGGFHHPFPDGVMNILECWNPEENKSYLCGNDSGKMIRNNGITLRRVENASIRDVVSHHQYSGGVVTEKLCVNLRFKNLEVHSNFFDGFAGYETTKSRVVGLYTHDNHSAGISIDADFNGNVFIGGLIARNSTGVFSADVDSNEYDGVNMKDNRGYGFYIENFLTGDGKGTVGSCDHTKIRNLEIQMPAGSKSAIHFEYPCQDVLVSNVSVIKPNEAQCITSTKLETQARNVSGKFDYRCHTGDAANAALKAEADRVSGTDKIVELAGAHKI